MENSNGLPIRSRIPKSFQRLPVTHLLSRPYRGMHASSLGDVRVRESMRWEEVLEIGFCHALVIIKIQKYFISFKLLIILFFLDTFLLCK